MKPLDAAILDILQRVPSGLSTNSICNRVKHGHTMVTPVLAALSDQDGIHYRNQRWHFGARKRITFGGAINLALMQQHQQNLFRNPSCAQPLSALPSP